MADLSFFANEGGNLTINELIILVGNVNFSQDIILRILVQQPRYVLTSTITNGRTLMHCASMFSNIEAMKALLRLECSYEMINRADDEGNTPLLLACRIKNSKLASLLLDNKADPTIVNNDKLSLVHYAAIVGDHKFLHILGQRVDLAHYVGIASSAGMYPLHLASKHGTTKVMDILIKKGADVNLPDGAGESPLFLACRSTSRSSIELLLEKGAKDDEKSASGTSLMEVLISRQAVDCIELFMTRDLKFITEFTNLTFDLSLEDKSVESFVQKILRDLLELRCQSGQHDTFIELRRDMEGRVKGDLKIIAMQKFGDSEDDFKSKLKRCIHWLAYTYKEIDEKNRLNEAPDYVKNNRSQFPGFFKRLWRNPRKAPKTKTHKKTGSLVIKTNRSCMYDIWEILSDNDQRAQKLDTKTKCFLLDCYYLWTKDSLDEERFCKTIVKYKAEIKELLLEDPDSLMNVLSFLGSLAQIPELDEFIGETLYQCPLEGRLDMFHKAISRINADDEQTISLNVNRTNIYETSCETIGSLKPEDYINFAVIFEGEDGRGEGVRTEWLHEIIKHLLDTRIGLFASQNDGLNFQPSNISSNLQDDHLVYFNMAGKVIALSLFYRNTIDVHFTRSFYKHILGFPLSYEDLPADQVEMMKHILENDVDALELDFTYSYTNRLTDQRMTIELIPHGGTVVVTEENKERYVELRSTHIMTESIKLQINHFVKGFYEVVPKGCIRYFKCDELELLLCGLPEINVKDWKASTEYEKCEITKWFWEIVGKFSRDSKQKLLLFWAGFPRVPYGGFQYLDTKKGKPLSISTHYMEEDMLPTASVCPKLLKLSQYSSKNALRDKLKFAIKNSYIGFGLV